MVRRLQIIVTVIMMVSLCGQIAGSNTSYDTLAPKSPFEENAGSGAADLAGAVGGDEGKPAGDVSRGAAMTATLPTVTQVRTFDSGDANVGVVEVDTNVFDLHLLVKEDVQGRLSMDRSTETPSYRSDEGRILNNFEEIGNELWSDDSAVEAFRSRNPGLSVSALADNTSLFWNEWFVAYKEGVIFHTIGEDYASRSYTSLIVTKSGEIRMEEVTYQRIGEQTQILIGGKDVSDTIEFATFGQFLLDGSGRPREDFQNLIPKFQDLRHVFAFPKILLAELPALERDSRGDLYVDLKARKKVIGKKEIFFGVSDLTARGYALATQAWGSAVSLPLIARFHVKDRSGVVSEGGVAIPPSTLRTALALLGYEQSHSLEEVTSRGQFYLDEKTQELRIFLKLGPYPRTMVGLTSDGNLKLVGVGGKSGRSGINLKESADLAVDLGLKQAMLLDHGGSAKIFANGSWLQPSSENRAWKTSALVVATRPAPVLIRILVDEDGYVQRTAGEALGKLPKTDAVLAVLKAQSPKNSDIRAAVKRGASSFREPAAVHALLKLLADEDMHVVSQAAIALGEIADPAAVSALVVAFHYDDRGVRLCVAEALGKIGDRTAIPYLVKMLSAGIRDEVDGVHGGGMEAEVAARALGNIGDPQAVPPLAEATRYQFDAWLVAPTAVEALAKIEHRAAVPALIAALNNPIVGSRYDIIIKALGKIGDPRAVAPLLDHLWDSWGRFDKDVEKVIIEIGEKNVYVQDIGERKVGVKNILKKELKRVLKYRHFGWNGAVQRILVKLGDDETAQEVMQRYNWDVETIEAMQVYAMKSDKKPRVGDWFRAVYEDAMGVAGPWSRARTIVRTYLDGGRNARAAAALKALDELKALGLIPDVDAAVLGRTIPASSL